MCWIRCHKYCMKASFDISWNEINQKHIKHLKKISSLICTVDVFLRCMSYVLCLFLRKNSSSWEISLQGCFQCGGCHQKAWPTGFSPQCPTYGVMESCSMRWLPLEASPFKASQTIRSFKLILVMKSPYLPPVILNGFGLFSSFCISACSDAMRKTQILNGVPSQVLLHVKAGNTLTIPQGIKSQM